MGCKLLATPLLTRGGRSYLSMDDHLWELAPWLPGVADFHRAGTPHRVRAAISALAELHQQLASVSPRSNHGGPPGIASRLRTMEQLFEGRAERIAMTLKRKPPAGEMGNLAADVMAAFQRFAEPIRRQLAAAQAVAVPRQVCLRDVWHAHVLFEGDRVTGIVDYGAMDIDSVSADLGRLLGSTAGDDADLRNAAIAAYRAVRPLSAVEESLIEVYDASGTLMGAMNWLRWIVIERRTFSDSAAVAQRLRDMLQRMNHWC